MSIQELTRAFDRGALTSRELVAQHLDRIAVLDKAGPAVNAFITVDHTAVDTAAELDRERARTGKRGPLHGIPIVLKDNVNTADLPTTAGNALFRDYVPGNDATVTDLLRRAGGIVVGKANMHEWAMGASTVSSLGGQTRNPYDPHRSPGGSSGGTAAAVAAGFATAGLGTDTLGSIRIPAARNNCVGLRPTAGLVSRAGIIPLSTTQDAVGPITRTVTDAALLLDVIAGPDPADPARWAPAARAAPTCRSSIRTRWRASGSASSTTSSATRLTRAARPPTPSWNGPSATWRRSVRVSCTSAIWAR